jgi:NADPH-dependent glutamate synthase beta subunit-like oxidoreductase
VADAVVVGAGQSGLAAAWLLAKRGVRTTVVDRLPAPGGQEPEGAPERRLAAGAGNAGVRMLLATMGVAWSGEGLTTLGVDGASTLPAGALVLATGTRPLTRGELGIAGDRCAGILPASAALHLIESGVLLGRHPIVYGGGGLAARCAELALEAGAREVTVVSELPPSVSLPDGARRVVGWRIASAHGAARISFVWLEREGRRERLTTDALLLARGRVPMLNVEGAIALPGARADLSAPGVVPCHSSADPKDLRDAERTAAAAVEAALAVLGARGET